MFALLDIQQLHEALKRDINVQMQDANEGEWRRTGVARQRGRIWLPTTSHPDLQPSFFEVFSSNATRWSGSGSRSGLLGSRCTCRVTGHRLAIANRLFSSEFLCSNFLVCFDLSFDGCFRTGIFNFVCEYRKDSAQWDITGITDS
jgi:hypothetical protein